MEELRERVAKHVHSIIMGLQVNVFPWEEMGDDYQERIRKSSYTEGILDFIKEEK